MESDAQARDAKARRRAIDPERSCIVQAPAGSGKTSLLALRFLRLLADVEQPEQIVAITFTRKACAEMRHRIVRALAAASLPPDDSLPAHEREMRRLAQGALAASRARGWGLEHNPARLHIQTIDGLNHWLARRLPIAARISSGSPLVDDARPLYAEAARRTLARLDRAEPGAAELERLARALNHDPRQLAGLIESMLGTRELWLPKLFDHSPGTSLRHSIDALLESAIEAELARARETLRHVDGRELFGIVASAAATGPREGPLAPLAALRDWPDAVVSAAPEWRAIAWLLLKAAPKPELRKTVDSRQGFPASGQGAAPSNLKRRMVAVLAAVAELEGAASVLDRVRHLPPRALADSQWDRIEALCGVLPLAVAELVALCAERDRLDHAAVAAAAREALGDESSPSELALALDYRIRHLLVDEYQDTSPSQQRLLELLVAGWQPGDGRTLFCVGDPMQSIYGFREADVTLFLQAQRSGIAGVPLEPERLASNFRSSARVLDWVNATFARLLPADDDFERGAVRYSPAAAQHEGDAEDGVTVHALLDSGEREMGETVARIARVALQSAGKDGPASVAVLVRGRTSLPPVLAALRGEGIEYRGVELEPLADRAAVRDLVALAKAMLHAGDRPAWLSVLRAPWCGLALPDLLALAGDDAEALVPSRLCDPVSLDRLTADGRARVAQLWRRLQPAIAGRGERSLGGWLKSAWLAIDGPATVADASDLANAELLFAALDALEREVGCVPEASQVDAAVEGIMASPVGSEAARVQVMTIHHAKGLEFDVVIVPDLQRGVRGGERPLLYWTAVSPGPGRRGIVLASRADAQTEELAADPLERWMRRLGAERERLELGRLAYVAATRARRKLHLVGSATTRVKGERTELRPPGGASLLGFYWPVLAPEFEAKLAERADAAAGRSARRRPRRTAPPPVRLPLDFAAPSPAAPSRSSRLRIAGELEGSIRPEFDWAGAIAQAVGHVVHLELHRLAKAKCPATALTFRAAEAARRLRELGIDEPHLPEALARVEQALVGVSRSALAARLLDPAAPEAASELALTAHLDGVVQSLRIDRSFVDATGVRWIVDWKTSTHEGGDVDAFLDNELERYAAQLRRYAEVLALLDERPQRVGLYFPLLDAWREL
jgi:ATP-dependent exoDNAse (exonuclease V) beta subunit